MLHSTRGTAFSLDPPPLPRHIAQCTHARLTPHHSAAHNRAGGCLPQTPACHVKPYARHQPAHGLSTWPPVTRRYDNTTAAAQATCPATTRGLLPHLCAPLPLSPPGQSAWLGLRSARSSSTLRITSPGSPPVLTRSAPRSASRSTTSVSGIGPYSSSISTGLATTA